MAKYKVTATGVGPFTQGQIITDEDLNQNPGLGGVKRLRDELKAIEDHFDAPPANPAPATKTTTTRVSGNPADAAPEKTTGHDDPNVVKGHGRSGKS